MNNPASVEIHRTDIQELVVEVQDPGREAYAAVKWARGGRTRPRAEVSEWVAWPNMGPCVPGWARGGAPEKSQARQSDGPLRVLSVK